MTMTTSSIIEMAMHMRAATGNVEHSDAFLAGLEKREAEREAQHRADEAKRSADQDRFIAAVQRELTLQRWFFVAAVAAMGLVVAAISVA